MCARRVEPTCLWIDGQVLKTYRLSPFRDWPFGEKFPVRVEYLYPAVYRIGNVYSVVSRIDRDRSRIVKLSLARSFTAPDRQHPAIGAEPYDPSVAPTNHID